MWGMHRYFLARQGSHDKGMRLRLLLDCGFITVDPGDETTPWDGIVAGAMRLLHVPQVRPEWLRLAGMVHVTYLRGFRRR